MTTPGNEPVFLLSLLRPRHLLKLILSPREMWRKFQYHWRRVSRWEFVSFLTGLSEAEVRGFELELQDRHRDFLTGIAERLTLHPDGYGGQMREEQPALYALVRHLKPDLMVETGVADGISSAHILRAMEDNGKGMLYSVDLPRDTLPPGKGPGWIVPDSLRHRWSLRVGNAREILGPLLEEAGEIDIFFHDSLHTYEHMMFEFRTAYPRIRHGGVLLSHDVGRNFAFLDIAAQTGHGWADYRIFHVLGGFRKNKG